MWYSPPSEIFLDPIGELSTRFHGHLSDFATKRKGQCQFALLQHTEKFWNVFFQTFQARLLFFSGTSLPCDSWLLLISRLSHPFATKSFTAEVDLQANTRTNDTRPWINSDGRGGQCWLGWEGVRMGGKHWEKIVKKNGDLKTSGQSMCSNGRFSIETSIKSLIPLKEVFISDKNRSLLALTRSIWNYRRIKWIA